MSAVLAVQAVTNAAILTGELLNLLGKVEVYRSVLAKAQAEGRDVTDEERDAAIARLGAAIEAGEKINASLPDKK